MEIKILFEDKDIIVAIKPPKVPSQPDKTGDEDMLSYIIKHTGIKDIGLIQRLDRPVGGIMVFGKSKKATEGLNKSVGDNEIKKTYYAVVCGVFENSEGELKDFVLKNQKLNISKIVSENTKGAKQAVLSFKVLESIKNEDSGDLTLVKISLKTGRHHQIRVQFSNIKRPLWGDNKYNEEFMGNKKWTQIALWSGGLEFNHPISGEKMTFLEFPDSEIFRLFNIFI